MKFFISASLVLLISTALWAQGGGPDYIEYCKCLDDAVCTATQCNSAADTDCRSLTITAPSSAFYIVRALLECSDGQYCENCCAEAIMTGPGGFNAVCHTPCSPDNCKYDCPVYLEQGVNYTLYTCLRDCSGESCDDCNTGNCLARAILRLHASDPCTWPCN